MKPRTLGKRGRGQLPSQVVWDYSPTERQKQAHDNPSRYKLYGGALGGGKTIWLSAEAIRLSLSYPGNRGYFCRQYVTDFKRSTLVTFSRLCPAPFIRKHYRDDRIIEFFNGSEILYGGLGSEEDLERIKSTEFGWFGIDEATEASQEFFLLLCGRLRWKLPDGTFPRFHGLLASNPEPGWVKDRFVDQRLPNHAFIPALPRDNPHNPKDYDSNLRALYPEEWVKRYLDGSWDVFEGQIYKEFDRKVHCYDHVEVGKYWDKYRVIDHGYTNPTCCIYVAIDHDGTIWVHDEHYERFLTIEENAHVIKSKQPDWGEAITLIDPSCFSATQQGSGKICSVADEYAKHGIVAISPYSRDGKMEEAVGINLVKRYFKANRLRIHERCIHGIRELLRYRWRDLGASARGNQNEYEIPVDKDNHFVDCIRYFCAYRPPDAPPPPPPAEANTVHAAIMKHKKQSGQTKFVGW